jgi:hypothetical protein
MSQTSVEGLVEGLMECSDSDLDGRVRALELERRRIDAELAMTVGEIDRRRSYLDDGHRSIKAYLRATCNHSDAEAARLGRLTVAVAGVPALAEALHGGRIGTPQANELAVAHANARIRDRLGEFAPVLLELAERLSFREFRTCLQRFVVLADLDGAHRVVDESIRNRRAHVVNLNGSLCLDAGGGDPLVNVELEAIFRLFCELEYDADVAGRRAEHGDRADDHPLHRTASQRSYDAFVAIMRGALANHDAGRSAPASEPLVTILTDHRTWGDVLASAGLAPDATLAGEAVDPFTALASPADLLADLTADPHTLAARRCETSTGQILHPHAVLRAALAGHIRRAVLGADNLPINLGRKVRVFTGAARRAAMLLAVQCDHPGCGLPADSCQIDHSTEWSTDGRTDQDNAGVECGSHNRLKTRKRWRTRRDIHGRIHTIRSDGTIMLPVGVRAPVFPDEADARALAVLPPELVHTIDDWVDAETSDIERRCRNLRRTAIHHAITLDEGDIATMLRHLRRRSGDRSEAGAVAGDRSLPGSSGRGPTR